MVNLPTIVFIFQQFPLFPIVTGAVKAGSLVALMGAR